MIKLHGHPFSTCTRKVLFTLRETKTPFELSVVDFAKGEHKAPPHLAYQPFGQVPAIDDDGFVLYESRAIARYLDAKAGHPLSPSALQDHARMEQWISVETSNFAPHAMKFVYQHVFKREQTPEALETAKKGLDLACTVLDKNLVDKAFLCGDALTLADIAFAPYLGYAMGTPAKDILGAHPHVMAWWNRVAERPAWIETAAR